MNVYQHNPANPSISVAGLDVNYKFLIVLSTVDSPERVCKVGRSIQAYGVGNVDIEEYCGFDTISHLFKIKPLSFWVLDEHCDGIARRVVAEYLVARPAVSDLPWYQHLKFYLLHRFKKDSVVPTGDGEYRRGFYPCFQGIGELKGVPFPNSSYSTSGSDPQIRSTFSDKSLREAPDADSESNSNPPLIYIRFYFYNYQSSTCLALIDTAHGPCQTTESTTTTHHVALGEKHIAPALLLNNAGVERREATLEGEITRGGTGETHIPDQSERRKQGGENEVVGTRETRDEEEREREGEEAPTDYARGRTNPPEEAGLHPSLCAPAVAIELHTAVEADGPPTEEPAAARGFDLVLHHPLLLATLRTATTIADPEPLATTSRQVLRKNPSSSSMTTKSIA